MALVLVGCGCCVGMRWNLTGETGGTCAPGGSAAGATKRIAISKSCSDGTLRSTAARLATADALIAGGCATVPSQARRDRAACSSAWGSVLPGWRLRSPSGWCQMDPVMATRRSGTSGLLRGSRVDRQLDRAIRRAATYASIGPRHENAFPDQGGHAAGSSPHSRSLRPGERCCSRCAAGSASRASFDRCAQCGGPRPPVEA